MPAQLKLDDLCGDVMNMNLPDDQGSSLASKSEGWQWNWAKIYLIDLGASAFVVIVAC